MKTEKLGRWLLTEGDQVGTLWARAGAASVAPSTAHCRRCDVYLRSLEVIWLCVMPSVRLSEIIPSSS